MHTSEKKSKLKKYFTSLGIYHNELLTPEALTIIQQIQSSGKHAIQTLNSKNNTFYRLILSKNYLKQLEPHIQSCTNKFLNTNNYEWHLNKVEVIKSGKSYPLKCTLHSSDLNTDETIYIKNYSITESARPFGLLLLHYATNVAQNYKYIISDNILIEKEIKGIQIPLGSHYYRQPKYQSKLIEMTLTSFRIGLKEIQFYDRSYPHYPTSHVVTPDATHVPIDLEHLGTYTAKEITTLHQLIQCRLEITQAEYLNFVQNIHTTLHSSIMSQHNELKTLTKHITLLTPPSSNQKHYLEYADYITQNRLSKYIYLLS